MTITLDTYALLLPSDSFACECDTPERHAYLVTDHEGAQSAALYCRGCADLARVDWTGETAALAPLVAVWRIHDGTDQAVLLAGRSDLGDEVWLTSESALSWAQGNGQPGNVWDMSDHALDERDDEQTDCALCGVAPLAHEATSEAWTS